MKKWFKVFSLSFFSHTIAKESAKRGYTNAFLGFVIALIFLWVGFFCGDMLPFGTHYNHAPDFMAVVRGVFANTDTNKRMDAEIEKGVLKVKKHNGQYTESLFVNTFERDADQQIYAVNGYNLVVDMRPAKTLAEVEAYCVSNDGKNMVISYEDYLTLSDVAKLNFDFRLRYTGNALELNDEVVAGYGAYLCGLQDENKDAAEKLAEDLSKNAITKAEYNRAIYELYFVNYYPEITAYESGSKVPLLRNYYYHQYISKGAEKYLFIFDDYMAGSFETKSGMSILFYGFYSDLEDGALVLPGATGEQANKAVDAFVKNAFKASGFLNGYAYALNMISLVPFIALMLMVAALLSYSVLRLRGVESVTSLGAMFKIVGSFAWFSGVIAAATSVLSAFFVQRSMISTLPLVLFFAVLAIRSILFAINESNLYMKQLEQQEAE